MHAQQALWRLTAAELSEGYASAAFDPLDVARACLARIEQSEPTLNAMVHVDPAGALAAAEASAARWCEGAPLGPLDGVPVTVKDNLHVAGMPTRWGSLATCAEAQRDDEEPVRRMRAAGAVILGKTNLPPFALQGFTSSAVGGLTRNPRDTRLGPGGSSGGAAASVAAGYAPLAIATDGGGSIRRPAAYCGVLGFKPSEGLIDRRGGLPDLFDGHEVVGGFARCVADLRMLLETLSAQALAPSHATGARVLFLPRLGPRPVDTRVAAAVRAFAEALAQDGLAVSEQPSAQWAERVHAAWPKLSAAGLAWMLGRARQWPMLFTTHGTEALEAVLDPDSLALWHRGASLPATELVDLADAVAELRESMRGVFSAFDFILTPAASSTAWSADQPWPSSIDGHEGGPRSDAVFTPFVNAAGLCGLSLPCGWVGGLPVSCQLIAPQGADAALLALASRFERFARALQPGPLTTEFAHDHVE